MKRENALRILRKCLREAYSGSLRKTKVKYISYDEVTLPLYEEIPPKNLHVTLLVVGTRVKLFFGNEFLLIFI